MDDLINKTNQTVADLDLHINDSSGHINVSSKSILVLTSVFGLCIILALVGNLMVCIAVLSEKTLKKNKHNYFIVSLAVSDLGVAGVVMSFAMANDIQQKWTFGITFCRLWISFDVMCSTASILNLCVISFDRYKHIQDAMYYDIWMTNGKALMFIFIVWSLSAFISFLPIQLGLHQTLEIQNISIYQDQCVIKLNMTYAVFSSAISFYLPCMVMMILYFKLFLLARQHAVNIESMKPKDIKTLQVVTCLSNFKKIFKTSENKAAKTLGVITGVFLLCWLPFFIINPLSAYNSELIPTDAFTVTTWLGYSNSCINPLIYTIFNTEFRNAFKRILCCHNISLQKTKRKKTEIISLNRQLNTMTDSCFRNIDITFV